MNVTVLGADGRLANAFARTAVAAGHDVVAVTRSGTLRHAVSGATGRTADAMDRDALVAACEGADVVFNGINPPYPLWRKVALPMARNVIAACRAAGAHLLFPGNVYNHGEAMPERLLPDTAEKPTTVKGRIRVDMEDAFARSGLDVTILRAGDFFGGDVPGSWFDLAVAAKVGKGIFTYPGPRDVVHEWAYVPDLAQTFVQLAEARPSGLRRLGFAGHAMTGDEMHAAAKRAAGRPLKPTGMPWRMMRVLGLLQPMMRELVEMEYLWRVPHAIDGAALRNAIGPVPHTPRDEAMTAALASLRS